MSAGFFCPRFFGKKSMIICNERQDKFYQIQQNVRANCCQDAGRFWSTLEEHQAQIDKREHKVNRNRDSTNAPKPSEHLRRSTLHASYQQNERETAHERDRQEINGMIGVAHQPCAVCVEKRSPSTI